MLHLVLPLGLLLQRCLHVGVFAGAFHIVRGQRKGGGVALYVHRRFNCAIRAVQCKVVEQVFECVTVELDLKNTNI